MHVFYTYLECRSRAVLVSLSKTLNHDCFVLRMGHKSVGPVKEPRTRKRTQDTYREREGACPGDSGFAR